MKVRSWIAAVAALGMAVIATGQATAAQIVTGGGRLVGAIGVLVDGVSFDVTFEEGTCELLYDGCDEPADLPFASLDAAESASLALVQQVFVAANGDFDLDPTLTLGCDHPDICQILTPYELFEGSLVRAAMAQNVDDTKFIDSTDQTTGGRDLDSTGRGELVFALWSRTPVTVDEPSILTLFGLTVLGIARIRRPHRRAELDNPV